MLCKENHDRVKTLVRFAITPKPEVDATLYHQLVGSILYLTHSCPNLSFVIGHVSRYMKTPHESHWKAKKIIL